MKLAAYCEGKPERKQVIADACEVTVPAVTHWCNGTRIPDPKYWRMIEKATGGKVSAEDWLDAEEQLRREAA